MQRAITSNAHQQLKSHSYYLHLTRVEHTLLHHGQLHALFLWVLPSTIRLSVGVCMLKFGR